MKKNRKIEKQNLKKKILKKLAEEQGSATVEASIWVPIVFFSVVLLMVLSLQWMEMGIVQGEMLITSSNSICYVDSEDNEKTLSEIGKQKIHFIKEAEWQVIDGKKKWQGQFKGSTKITGKRRRIVRKATARKEHPIRIIRRRKCFEEAISG